MQSTAASPLSSFLVLIGSALVVFAIWWFAMHNKFARLRNHIRESWSNVDVALKRRYDLIPNLVDTVRAYAAHERQTLEGVVEARNRALAAVGPIAEQAHEENELVHSVNRLLAVAEGYPNLKASQNFLTLQAELINTEDRIAAARRFYNANVREFNTLRESFPSSVVAGAMNLPPAEFFEVDSLSFRAAPEVNLA